VVCTLGRTCQSGACTTAVCTAGLADCDHDAANGCEVALDSDASHCGVCGSACAYANGAGVCTAGACSLARFTVPPQLNNNPYIGFRRARARP
jgi:hypothetical protein